jgi:hypothetical protein
VLVSAQAARGPLVSESYGALPLALKKPEILSYLGYPRSRSPSPKVLTALDRTIALAWPGLASSPEAPMPSTGGTT